MMEKPINPVSPGAEDQPDSREPELLAQLAALPKAVAPAQDAWQRIASRIDSDSAGLTYSGDVATTLSVANSGRAWFALAASLLLVVTSVVVVRNTADWPAAGHPPLAVNGSEALRLSDQGARVPATSIELEYQAAFKEFQAQEFAQASLGWVAGAQLQQDWQLMQRVEAELQVALEQEPGNPWLLQKLTQLRSRQLQLLHLIADSGQLPGGNQI